MSGSIETTQPMPVKVKPYRHQVEAFRFVCTLFGLYRRDDPEDSVPETTNHGTQTIQGGGGDENVQSIREKQRSSSSGRNGLRLEKHSWPSQ